MQTGMKDGKITIILSYEEWLEMSNMFKWTRLNRNYVSFNDQIAYHIFEEIMHLDVTFDVMTKKELAKVPDYLQTIIRELPPAINPNPKEGTAV